jgi:hypothetical protein
MASGGDIADFRVRFPELVDTLDPIVSAGIDDADVWLDPDMWISSHYQTGRMLWAAHVVKLIAQQASSGGGGPSAVETYLSRVKFGEREVEFRAPTGQQSSKNSPSGGGGIGTSWFMTSYYGQRFLMLRRQSISPIYVLT